jgi:hypothetical protein
VRGSSSQLSFPLLLAAGLGRPAVRSSSPVTVKLYRSLAAAGPYLRALAERAEGWTFDIETYDAVEFPSRKHVAVDPHHPDFRVRACAFATSATEGALVDFQGDQQNPSRLTEDILPLRAAFASDAEKGAFNGGFDECGLVYTGWVPQIRNRTRDGMLAMIALGDGTHERLTLAQAIVVLLHREVVWDADKSLMRDLPADVVADGAVHDACYTHELCDLLDGWAEEDRRIRWSGLTRA